MSIFGKKRKASGTIAKDRLKLLLISDRVSCSPQTMQMLKNDMIKAAGKYIPVDAGKVTICFCFHLHRPEIKPLLHRSR